MTSQLSPDEAAATGRWIASVQLRNGMIPWFPGGHADPWNHVEAAMALTLTGFVDEAAAAYEWLRDTQLDDGSWYLYHLSDGIEDPRRDPNVCAYLATGLALHWLETGDTALVEELWPVLDAALAWVLRLQRPGGEFAWSVDADGRVGRFALLTGTASTVHSLRAGAAVARLVGDDRPEWSAAADAAADAVAHRPEAFERKDRWAMDWYYPVLSGALEGAAGQARLEAGWRTFMEDGLGVRCVSDEPWVTVAETAECVIALDSVAMVLPARTLLGWTRHLRDDDGAYWTGCVHPQCVRYPGGERSTYSAAAVVLADHVVHASSASAGLFRPGLLDGPLPAPRPDQLRQAATREAAARRPDAMQAGTPTPW